MKAGSVRKFVTCVTFTNDGGSKLERKTALASREVNYSPEMTSSHVGTGHTLNNSVIRKLYGNIFYMKQDG